MAVMLMDAPPPGALTWLQGVLAASVPFIIALWRYWNATGKKLDKAADAADEAARQLRALHKSVDALKESLNGVDKRLWVIEDRSDREERERVPTPVHGVPYMPPQGFREREVTRAMGSRVSQPRKPPVKPESSPPDESGGIPRFPMDDESKESK